MASPVHLSSRAPLSPPRSSPLARRRGDARRPRARHARARARLARARADASSARSSAPRRPRSRPDVDGGPARSPLAHPRVSRRGRSPRVALVRAPRPAPPAPSPPRPARARPSGPALVALAAFFAAALARPAPALADGEALAEQAEGEGGPRERASERRERRRVADPPRVDHPRGRRRGDGGLQEREEGARHPGRPRRARAQARDEEAQEKSRPRGERTQQRRVPPRDVSSREADHAAGRVHGPLGLRLRPTPAVDRRPLLLGDPPRRRVGGDQSLRPRRLWRIRVPPSLLRVALRVPPPTPARRGVRSLGHRPEPRRARDLGRGREDPIAPRRRSG